MYINEVKRDNETLKKISEFQSSIENLVSVCGDDNQCRKCSIMVYFMTCYINDSCCLICQCFIYCMCFYFHLLCIFNGLLIFNISSHYLNKCSPTPLLGHLKESEVMHISACWPIPLYPQTFSCLQTSTCPSSVTSVQ